MIQIIPSLSVIKGQVVRLQQGDFKKLVQYDHNPIDTAKQFEDHGITKIHIIDLDGTRKGRLINIDTVEMIHNFTKLAIDFGGGVQTDGDLAKAFEAGADVVNVGSFAARMPELFATWIISYGHERISMSADALNGKIQVGAWQQSTDIDLFAHIDFFYKRGLKYLKCSDVSKDGTLQGPSYEIYKKIKEMYPELFLMASGGVRDIDDIKALADLGVDAVIVGKAFYENKISLKDFEHFIANYSKK